VADHASSRHRSRAATHRRFELIHRPLTTSRDMVWTQFKTGCFTLAAINVAMQSIHRNPERMDLIANWQWSTSRFFAQRVRRGEP
jgi:hypothetical protein